jgi:hypothetical protein
MSKLLTKEDKYEVLPSSAMAPPPKFTNEEQMGMLSAD